MFAQSMPNYDRLTHVSKSLSGVDIDRYAMRTETETLQDRLATVDELSEDHLLLAPPNLYGFSLADKEWRELPTFFLYVS